MKVVTVFLLGKPLGDLCIIGFYIFTAKDEVDVTVCIQEHVCGRKKGCMVLLWM